MSTATTTAESLALVDAIEERERRLVAAIEDLSQDTAVQSAWQQGVQHERDRIDRQLIQLVIDGELPAAYLRTLRRLVLEVQP
jgi:hypothetical protein